MLYREIALPSELHGVALCAWQFLLEPHDPPVVQHQVPPDGTTGLVLTRAGDGTLHGRVLGPMLSAFTVPVVQGFGYAGLRLRPEMARIVTGTGPLPGTITLADLNGPFACVWADLAALMDGACDWSRTIGGLSRSEHGDPAITEAVDGIIASAGTIPVARLAALAGLSQRQFRRRFHAATGITAKQYANVQRVRHALILSLEDADWAGIAHDSGFSDQPHLARDIRERFGVAPRRIAGYFHGMRHELLAPGDVRNLQSREPEAA